MPIGRGEGCAPREPTLRLGEGLAPLPDPRPDVLQIQDTSQEKTGMPPC